MKPLHFGAKGAPRMPGKVIATVTPKGPVLNLQPVQDRIAVTNPDEDDDGEIGKIGAIHLPGSATLGQFNPYAEVRVLAIGPDVKTVKEGDSVIVVRPQVQKVSFSGNLYYWTSETAVMGIIRP